MNTNDIIKLVYCVLINAKGFTVQGSKPNYDGIITPNYESVLRLLYSLVIFLNAENWTHEWTRIETKTQTKSAKMCKIKSPTRHVRKYFDMIIDRYLNCVP